MQTDLKVHARSKYGAPADVQIGIEHELDAVETVWRYLESTAETTLFQTWTWQKTWFDTVGAARGDDPAIIIIRDDAGTPLGLLPFVIRRRRGFHEVSWLAEEFLDYGMPLLGPALLDPVTWIDDGTLWQKIMRKMPAQVVRLENMPTRIGSAINPLCVALPVEKSEGACYCDLADHADLDSFLLTRYTPRKLAKERRKERHLREIDPVRIVAATCIEEAEEVIDALYAQKIAQLHARGEASIFDDPNYRKFMLRLWQDADPALRPDLRALWVGDEVGATGLSVVFRDRHYYLQTSRHLGEIGKYSPGNELTRTLISDSIEEKLPVFDFCLGCESYKQKYATGKITLYRHSSACSLAGRLALAGIAVARPSCNWALHKPIHPKEETLHEYERPAAGAGAGAANDEGQEGRRA